MLDSASLGPGFVVAAEDPDGFGKPGTFFESPRASFPVDGLESLSWRRIRNEEIQLTVFQFLAVYDGIDSAERAFDSQSDVVVKHDAQDVEEIDEEMSEASILVAFTWEGMRGLDSYVVALLRDKNIVTVVQVHSNALLTSNAIKYFEKALAKIQSPTDGGFLSIAIQAALDELEQSVTDMTLFNLPEYDSRGPEVFIETDDDSWSEDVKAVFSAIYEAGHRQPEWIDHMSVVLTSTDEGPSIAACEYEDVHRFEGGEIAFEEFKETWQLH